MSIELNTCPCGSIMLPRGSKHIEYGLKCKIISQQSDIDLDLLHNNTVILDSGQRFATASDKINTNIIPKEIIVYSNNEENIISSNIIQIIVKEFNTKKIIATKVIGRLDSEYTWEKHISNGKSSVSLYTDTNIDLVDNYLLIEFISICDNGLDPCCDKLPSEIALSGIKILCVPLGDYYDIPRITTTTTTTQAPIQFISHPITQTVYEGNPFYFTFSAATLDGSNFAYWWEESNNNGARWFTLIPESSGSSGQFITYSGVADLSINNTIYRSTITIPDVIYSNHATLIVLATTTTTTTTSTTTTTLPPVTYNLGVTNSLLNTTTDNNIEFFGSPNKIIRETLLVYPNQGYGISSFAASADNDNIIDLDYSHTDLVGTVSVAIFMPLGGGTSSISENVNITGVTVTTTTTTTTTIPPVTYTLEVENSVANTNAPSSIVFNGVPNQSITYDFNITPSQGYYIVGIYLKENNPNISVSVNFGQLSSLVRINFVMPVGGGQSSPTQKLQILGSTSILTTTTSTTTTTTTTTRKPNAPTNLTVTVAEI